MARLAKTDPRRVAWQTLTAVESGSFADAELGRRLAQSDLEARDRALAARIVYGTLAWQGQLDFFIAALGHDPQRLDPPLRTLIRMALYQLTRLGRVPDFAAVSTAVDLSKSYRRGVASGLVNALLRRFLREKDGFQFPARDDDLVSYLTVRLSHPRWLVQRWVEELGEHDAEQLLAANNEAAPTVLRVNTRRTTRDRLLASLHRAGIEARPGTFAPHAIKLQGSDDPATLPGWQEGQFTVQGEASQIVALLAGVRDGMRVLDACAAPGGKATALAETAGESGQVVAVDLQEAGLEHLQKTARRLGLNTIRTVHGDAAEIAPALGSFDVVLVDAPCSGLGTLRQHPEIRWRRTVESIAEIAREQRRLLDATAACVEPHGVLVYATCTISRPENEDVIEAFLARHPDFRADDPRPHLPAAAHILVDASGFLRTFPHRHGLDGFFAARFVRTNRKSDA